MVDPAAFQRCATLSDAIVVGLAQRPELIVIEVVVQDEFTHDVIFGVPGGGPVIVLDCT
jgi:hypothetical protein